jgi:hypothetical protein
MGTTAYKVKEKERACLSHLTACSLTTTIISSEAAAHGILTCTVNFGNMSRLAVKSKHLYTYSYIPLCYILWVERKPTKNNFTRNNKCLKYSYIKN